MATSMTSQSPWAWMLSHLPCKGALLSSTGLLTQTLLHPHALRTLFIPVTMGIFMVSAPLCFATPLSSLEAHEQPMLDPDHIFLLRETGLPVPPLTDL